MEFSKERYLHLDLKGAVPISPKRLISWVHYLRIRGFFKLVLEVDCRIQWDTWPGAGEVLYTKQDIRDLIAVADGLDMEVIPLIQMHGHLEWILKHEEYADLREGDHQNELCPKNPKSMIKMKQWIDEAAELFYSSKRIHLGCDEAWNIGSCPKCQEAIEKDPLKRGKMGLFIDHAAELCRYAAEEKHLQPIIWDDMFCHDNGASLKHIAAFPKNTIFTHWKYGLNTQDQLDLIRYTGMEVWGASAIRCSWRSHFYGMLNVIGDRLANIAQWDTKGVPLLHTTWGRPTNNWDMYGPWEALIPEFIAAGWPTYWVKHPWRLFTEALDRAMKEKDPQKLREMAAEAERLPADNAFEAEGKRYFALGAVYEALHLEAWDLVQMIRLTNTLGQYGKPTRDSTDQNMIRRRMDFVKAVEDWEKDLAKFWQDNMLSDYEEYRDCHLTQLFLEQIKL